MTIDECNTLVGKAKTRKDGVYTWNGYLYVVKNNRFMAYSDCSGNCFASMGAFHYGIGKVERYDRKKKLTEWLRSQK